MHQHPLINWGIRPVLFQVEGININSYPFFVFFGLLVGGLVYFFEARKHKDVNENSFFIAIGALTGAAIGAKLFEILINIDRFEVGSFLMIITAGKTIVGGLIGGTLGSFVTKKILKINTRKGNLFAPAIAIGLAIGRIGCFFNGCCYGKPTSLPWGVDFGDKIFRHPTQIYESLFMLGMFIFFKFRNRVTVDKPGYLFYILMVNYFIFRFLIEFIREERLAIFGLTFFQIISIFVLIYLFVKNRLLTNKLSAAYGK